MEQKNCNESLENVPDWVRNRRLQRWRDLQNMSHSHPCGPCYHLHCVRSWAGGRREPFNVALIGHVCVLHLHRYSQNLFPRHPHILRHSPFTPSHGLLKLARRPSEQRTFGSHRWWESSLSLLPLPPACRCRSAVFRCLLDCLNTRCRCSHLREQGVDGFSGLRL